MKSKPLLIALGLLLICQVGLAQKIDVTMKSGTVPLTGKSILLGDIAEVAFIHPDAVKLIKAIKVHEVSDGQTNCEITKQQVQIRLLMQGIGLEEIEISGPESVRVSNQPARDPKSWVENKVQQMIADQYGIDAADIRVSVQPTFQLPQEAVLENVTFATLSQTQLPLGRWSIEAAYPGRTGQRGLSIPLDVAMVRTLAAAKVDIPAGTKLTAEHLEEVRRPITQAKHAYLASAFAIGQTTRNNIEAHSLISRTDIRETTLQDEALINRNDIVTLVLSRNGIRVQLNGVKALSSGRQGEPIQVLNPNTNRPLVAQVVDSTTVTIR